MVKTINCQDIFRVGWESLKTILSFVQWDIWDIYAMRYLRYFYNEIFEIFVQELHILISYVRTKCCGWMGGLSTKILIFPSAEWKTTCLPDEMKDIWANMWTKQLKRLKLFRKWLFKFMNRSPTQSVFMFRANFREASLGGREELINNQRILWTARKYLNVQKKIERPENIWTPRKYLNVQKIVEHPEKD